MITVTVERFPLVKPFTISRGTKTEAAVLTVTIARGGQQGRGECVPYPRYGHTLESVAAEIRAVPAGITRAELQQVLPPGPARNAVDCALWDLEAKASGVPVWRRAGLARPAPIAIARTISLSAPETMRDEARRFAGSPLLKVKLGTPDDMARVEAVRAGAPRSVIIVDANEGWTPEVYSDLAPHLMRLGVAMVEQPLPQGKDDMLAEIARPLPVTADESAHDAASLAALKGRYDAVNLKLDKTGGLTGALAARVEAARLGFRLMIGCMVSTSLSMAPAALVAQGAEWADLDGPIDLKEDRPHAMRFENDRILPAEPELWG